MEPLANKSELEIQGSSFVSEVGLSSRESKQILPLSNWNLTVRAKVTEVTVKVFSPSESGCGLPKKNWPFAVVLAIR